MSRPRPSYDERRRAFIAANHSTDEQFLAEIGFPPGTTEARVALAIRAAIAAVADLPPQSIRAGHSLDADLGHSAAWIASTSSSSS